MASGAGPSHKLRHVCELCDVRVESASTLQAHFTGKRHQRLLSMKEGHENQADRSVFITGFGKGTSELELTDYFNKYGNVSNVFMDKDKGAYAIVEFSTKDIAHAVLQSSPHFLHGQELTIKPREVKAFSPKSKHKRQMGTADGQGADQEELLRAMCSQQSVNDQMSMLMQYHQIPPEGVRVRYLVCNLLQEVLKEFFPACRVFPFGSSVNGFGRPACDLDLYLDFGRSKFDYQFATSSSVSEKNLTDLAKGEATVKETVDSEEINSTEKAELDSDNMISMEDIESASVEELLDLLASILKRCAPGCAKVQVVPSSRCPVVKFIHKDTGLRCDISINNRLALHNTELLHVYRTVHPGLRPLVFVVREWARLSGIAGNSAGGGPRLTNYALTWMVVFYLQTEGVLPSVQELRAVCEPSEALLVDGWNCSFTRQMDKFPTKDKSQVELLKGFFHFFNKFEFETSVVSPLTGQHLSVTQVSTNQIISTVGVQGESTNQNRDQSQALQTTNQASTSQEVAANERSDSCQQFKIGPINIQDPFELSHNVAGNVNEKTAQRIAEEFNKAAEICAKQNFGTKMSYLPESVPWGVAKLLKTAAKSKQQTKKQCLHQTPTGSPSPVSPEQRSPGVPSEKAPERDLVIPIQMKMSKLPPHFVTAFSNSDELRQAWCEKVEGFVGELFTHVLKMEERSKIAKAEDIQERLEEVSKTTETCVSLNEVEQSDIRGRKRAHSPVEQESNVKVKREECSEGTDLDLEGTEVNERQGHSHISEGHLKVTYVTKHRVWVGRRKVRRNLAKDAIPGLSLEEQVTNQIVEEDPAGGTEMVFQVHYGRKYEVNSTALDLRFSPGKGGREFWDLFHFLELFLVKMVDNHMME
ncbi:speckle targeted PIP5K1A-regulated poly(A) polymerase-like [Branchiostoma lanceolatum]|uniref:speckle targeted PIP5K1A-regulated poly(A) polymerase-like n=1 Tax=Branchiostoma lanceolatum TaxID=7740 RepID=UPI0034539201